VVESLLTTFIGLASALVAAWPVLTAVLILVRPRGLSARGRVDFYNAAGSVQIIADVAGWMSTP
jgi:hypothetical protein